MHDQHDAFNSLFPVFLQAFWLLDHEDYEEAVNMLLDPLISSNDIEAWQHRAVLVSLLAQGHPKLALKYSRIRKPPQKDLADIQVKRDMYHFFVTSEPASFKS